MKKIALIALVFVLVLSLAACGRNNDDNMQDNNQNPTTDLPIVPDVTPDDSTNIPDPEVNSNSTTNNNGGADMMPGDNGTTGNDNGTTGNDNGTTNNGTTGNNAASTN